MDKIKDIICTDPEILSGQPVFTGSRVPVVTLFFHLERGVSLDEFLEDFPSVKREQAIAGIRFQQSGISFQFGHSNPMSKTD